MIRDVLNHLDFTACAEVGLGLFFAVFVAIAIRTLRVARSVDDQHAAIVLQDDTAPRNP